MLHSGNGSKNGADKGGSAVVVAMAITATVRTICIQNYMFEHNLVINLNSSFSWLPFCVSIEYASIFYQKLGSFILFGPSPVPYTIL